MALSKAEIKAQESQGALYWKVFQHYFQTMMIINVMAIDLPDVTVEIGVFATLNITSPIAAIECQLIDLITEVPLFYSKLLISVLFPYIQLYIILILIMIINTCRNVRKLR